MSFGPSLVTDHLQAIVTVLSLVNPFMCAAIFAQIEAGRSPGTKMATQTEARKIVALAVGLLELIPFDEKKSMPYLWPFGAAGPLRDELAINS